MKTEGTIRCIENGILMASVCPSDGLEKLVGEKCVFEIKKRTARRSVNANSYFHVLCDKMRLVLGRSLACVKNWMITSYGQVEYIDEAEPLFIKTTAPPEYVQEREEIHMRLVRVVPPEPPKTKESYIYRVYRGSHTYNVAEMQKLLDGTIAEAQDMGIETMTPDAIRQMMERWGTNLR